MSTLTLLPASYNNSAACTGTPPQKNRIGIGVQAVFSEVSNPLTSPHIGFSVRLRNNGERKLSVSPCDTEIVRTVFFVKHSEKYSSFYRLRVNPWVSMFIAFLILLVISPLITQGLFTLYPSVSVGDHPLFSSARLLLPSALTITGILVWARTMDKLSLKDLGLTQKKVFVSWVIGSLCGAGLIAVVLVGLILLGAAHLSWGGVSSATPILLGALVYAVQGLSEEVVFRGYLLNVMSSRWGMVAGILVNSVLFAAAHIFNVGFSIVAFINLFLAGTVLASLYWLSVNVWLVSAVHAAWNFTLGIILGGAVSGTTQPVHLLTLHTEQGNWLITGGSFGIEGSLSCFIVLVAVRAVLWRRVVHRYSITSPFPQC